MCMCQKLALFNLCMQIRDVFLFVVTSGLNIAILTSYIIGFIKNLYDLDSYIYLSAYLAIASYLYSCNIKRVGANFEGF